MLVDGVTTNPTLIYKSGKDFREVIKEISTIVKGPISAEVTSTESQDMIDQGLELAKISNNIVVKVPLTADGLIACKKLSSSNIKVNVTLCFFCLTSTPCWKTWCYLHISLYRSIR